MQTSTFTVLLLASVAALQVAASAPRCDLQYDGKAGLKSTSGCPAYPVENHWTHCCIVPMSHFDAFHPKPGNYTGYVS